MLKKIAPIVKICKTFLKNPKVFENYADIDSNKGNKRTEIMGLGVDNITLLTLTRRKSDCQLELSKLAGRKMAMTRATSNLTQDYNSKMQAKMVNIIKLIMNI